MVLHSSSLSFVSKQTGFERHISHSLTGKPTRRLPHQSKVFEGMGRAGKGNVLEKVSLLPALSPYLFAMPVNAAGKSRGRRR